MVAHERRREVAILRALGATKGYVIRLMLAESFFLSIAGGLVGIGTAALILILFQDFIAFSLKIPFIFPSFMAILYDGGTALLLSAGIGGVSSIYPAIQINRSDPYETIRKGES
jgi:putative ABC transport system permease protein